MKQVAVDANVIINLHKADRFDVFERLAQFRFNVTLEVKKEVEKDEYPRQRDRIRGAFASGALHKVALDAAQLETLAELHVRFHLGESSCLAIAENRGWHVATDETRKLNNHLKNTIGMDRVLRSKDLVSLARGPTTGRVLRCVDDENRWD